MWVGSGGVEGAVGWVGEGGRGVGAVEVGEGSTEGARLSIAVYSSLGLLQA